MLQKLQAQDNLLHEPLFVAGHNRNESAATPRYWLPTDYAAHDKLLRSVISILVDCVGALIAIKLSTSHEVVLKFNARQMHVLDRKYIDLANIAIQSTSNGWRL